MDTFWYCHRAHVNRVAQGLGNQLGALWTDAFKTFNGTDFADSAAANGTDDGCPTFVTDTVSLKIEAVFTDGGQRSIDA